MTLPEIAGSDEAIEALPGKPGQLLNTAEVFDSDQTNAGHVSL